MFTETVITKIRRRRQETPKEKMCRMRLAIAWVERRQNRQNEANLKSACNQIRASGWGSETP